MLGSLVKEYAPNRQVWIGRYRWPARIGLDIPADQRDAALRVGCMDIAQKAYISARGEVGNFAGIVGVWQGVWPWPTARVDYDGEIDVGMGGDPVALLATV